MKANSKQILQKHATRLTFFTITVLIRTI